ncbi:MAG: hypothetical protein NZM44_00265, partial [Candidatus Calescibacterium sp.]|nr:hypothetical protein [Candidatus Calescibacterium sp.]
IVSAFYIAFDGGEYSCNSTITSYPLRWVSLKQNISTNQTNNTTVHFSNVFFGDKRRNIIWSYVNFNYTSSCLTINPVNNHAIFFVNETVNITSTSGSIIKVYDFDSREIRNGSTRLSLTNLSSGHYFVESSCGDRSQFMVLPRDYQGASFIGDDQISHFFGYEVERALRIKPKVVRVLSNSNYWSTVKPTEQGPFNFTLLNRTVNNAISIGAEKIIINLWWRPQWMYNETNDYRFLEKYLEYVNATARFFNNTTNRIKIAFAIWNEPHFEGTIGQGQDLPFVRNARTDNISKSYFLVLNASYHLIKRINPKYEVVGAAITRPFFDHNSSYFMNELGGINVLDSLGNTYKRKIPYEESLIRVFDDRGLNGTMFNYTESRFDDLLLRWKNSISGKEVYSYENALFGESALGIPYTYIMTHPLSEFSPSNISYQRGAYRASKQIILGRAANLSVILNHILNSYSSQSSTNYEMLGWEYSPINGPKHGRGPHPKTTYWVLTAYWLNNASFIEKRIINNETFLYGFRRNNGENIVFAWTKEGTRKNLIDNNLTARDISGKNVKVAGLGEEPVMFYSTTKNTTEIINDIIKTLIN